MKISLDNKNDCAILVAFRCAVERHFVFNMV